MAGDWWPVAGEEAHQRESDRRKTLLFYFLGVFSILRV
jgi:hypothetical protein